jgi:hypothetical protein
VLESNDAILRGMRTLDRAFPAAGTAQKLDSEMLKLRTRSGFPDTLEVWLEACGRF